VTNTPEATSAQSIDLASSQSVTSPPQTAANDPDNPRWGIVSALSAWLASLVMLAVVPNVCVLPYLAYRYAGTSTSREALLNDKTFVFLFVLGWLPAHLLTLALIWAIATRLGKLSLKEVFGWSWSPNLGLWRSVSLAMLLFLATFFLIARFGGPRTDLDRILESSRAAAVTLAALAVLTAPLVEEMIYRGLLYSAFRRALGQWAAVVIVTTMFAGLHVVQYWPNAGAISSITLLSLALTLIRARTGKLLPCFVVHLVFNGVQSVIIILEPYLTTLFEMYRHEPVNTVIFHLRLLFF
jgi:membrane protease YdiL (CAAX protease family)